MNYVKNQKYFGNFKRFNTYIIGLVGVGFILLLMSTQLGFVESGLVLLGMLFIAAGVGLYMYKKVFSGSDAEYDATVKSMLPNMETKALDKLNLDPTEAKMAPPLVFEGYVYKGASKARQGKDGKWRTNLYECIYIFFTEHETNVYHYIFDTTADIKYELTDTYFYKDIVSVSTALDTIKIGNNDIGFLYFKLTTTGGTSLTASINDSEKAQRSINAMRSLLKMKKHG